MQDDSESEKWWVASGRNRRLLSHMPGHLVLIFSISLLRIFLSSPPLHFPLALLDRCDFAFSPTALRFSLLLIALLRLRCGQSQQNSQSSMPTASRIQFDDDIHGAGATAGGVYAVRQRSPLGTGGIRSSSLTRHDSKESDIEAETNTVSERDIKQKQVRGQRLFGHDVKLSN